MTTPLSKVCINWYAAALLQHVFASRQSGSQSTARRVPSFLVPGMWDPVYLATNLSNENSLSLQMAGSPRRFPGCFLICDGTMELTSFKMFQKCLQLEHVGTIFVIWSSSNNVSSLRSSQIVMFHSLWSFHLHSLEMYKNRGVYHPIHWAEQRLRNRHGIHHRDHEKLPIWVIKQAANLW